MPPDADEIFNANDTIIVGGMNSSNEVIPATPPPADIPPSSQVAIPSTEDPGSPIDPSVSFKTEAADDRPDAVPSSLTPPPSTQLLAAAANNPAAHSQIPPSSQRSALFSPPTTVPQTTTRRATAAALPAGEYVPPTPQEVREAAPDALRAMMQESIAENSRLKMETAHYKLQLNLASLQAGEDAKRAAVEHDMARREVEALRDGESARQARRELSAATESARSKYLQARGMYEEAAGEVEHLDKRLRLAKKVIQQQEDEICGLRDDRQQLRIRIRENREHFNMLCSPGGIFHGVLTPKQGASGQSRGTPRGTPRQGGGKPDQHRFDALLQVLSQENNSAPSTPTSGKKAAPRPPSKHTRNVQSLSSLPTTPTAPRPGGLLPSVQLAPRTEPRHVGGRRLLPDSPRREEERRSRESTISVPDNEELARQALASVQKASSSLSRLSGAGRAPEVEDADVVQSQASTAASEMLRRDGGSFERAEGVEKRRISEARAEESPTKRVRVQERLGLGIQY